MRPSYRPELPSQPQSYRTQVLEHLGLVAGMFEELGIAEVIDHATQQDPAMRIVTAGHAVKAMVLHGLGFLNQQLYLERIRISFFGWCPFNGGNDPVPLGSACFVELF